MVQGGGTALPSEHNRATDMPSNMIFDAFGGSQYQNHRFQEFRLPDPGGCGPSRGEEGRTKGGGRAGSQGHKGEPVHTASTIIGTLSNWDSHA